MTTQHAAAAAGQSLWRVVPALGVAQIIAWGSLYYSIAVLATPMQSGLDLGETFVFGAFTMSLLISGGAAPVVGRLIDEWGGRTVLSAGSALGALALAIIAVAPNGLVFLIGWAIAGIALAAGLYEAAFATLNQVAGERYRQALTALTLFGGFASTVFWPLSHVLLETVGWRQTLGVYAALNFLVCLPIHLWLVPKRRSAPAGQPAQAAEHPTRRPMRPGYAWLAVAFSLGMFVFSVVSVHLIGLLRAAGLSAADAILIGALIGPMQVVGRMIEFVFARNVRATVVGAVSFGLMLAALVLLWFVQGLSALAFAFAALYGCSNGIMTIVRGSVPAELYGRQGYGELLGRLARPAFVARAVAPVVFAGALAGGLSESGGVLALALCALLGLISYSLATAAVRAQRGDAPVG